MFCISFTDGSLCYISRLIDRKLGSEQSIRGGGSCVLCISTSVEMSNTGDTEGVSFPQLELLMKMLNSNYLFIVSW